MLSVQPLLRCRRQPYLQRTPDTEKTTCAHRREILKPTDVFSAFSEEEAVKGVQRAAAVRAAMQVATLSTTHI